MTWLADNGIALAALCISGLAFWRTRHRVYVVARSMTASGGPDTGNANFTYVRLTVGSVGRAISVVHVSFRAVDGPETGQGASWGNPPDAATSFTPFEPLPTHFTGGELIADGASPTWSFSLYPPPSMKGEPWKTVQFVAEVELSNGKTVKSKPFWHAQSPPEGWDPMVG